MMLLQTVEKEDMFSSKWSGKTFLKWAGNKNRAKQHILPHLGSKGRLVEPFAGSCAISLNAPFDDFIISDTNADLISLYNIVKTDAAALLNELRDLFQPENNKPEAFYELRTEFNSIPSSLRKAALFVYLNRHGFNGLCRYNSKGGFNVPFGKYDQPYLPETEILEFAEFAQHAEFSHRDFSEAFEQAKAEDVIYCDPPYVPLSATSNFTSYAKDAFGADMQVRLAEYANAARNKGCRVLISNHDTPFTREIYAGAEIKSFGVMRLISSKASTRGEARELLAIFK